MIEAELLTGVGNFQLRPPLTVAVAMFSSRALTNFAAYCASYDSTRPADRITHARVLSLQMSKCAGDIMRLSFSGQLCDSR